MLPHVDAESSFSLLKGPFGDILHIQTGPYNMVNTIPRILMWKIDMYIYNIHPKMRHVTPTMIWIFFRWDVLDGISDGISNKCRNWMIRRQTFDQQQDWI
jgi:hypothetical protein